MDLLPEAGVMKRFFDLAVVIAGAFAGAGSLLAVEAKPIKISDKWSVVGVITSSNPSKDVAVLKNNETTKTYTLTLGENLPSDYEYVLKEIKRRSVIITDGDKNFTLSFVDVPVSEEADDFQNSVRFIDNYYRGLADSPIELFNKDRVNDSAGTAAVVPIKNFGTLSEGPSSRFDAYEQAYGDEQPAGLEETDEEFQNFQPEYSDAPVFYNQQEVTEEELDLPVE